MSPKGTNMSNVSILSAELFFEKISPIGSISSKKMFGGHGMFHDGKMFGLIDSKGNYFIKADDSNRKDFESFEAVQHSRMPYFSIPEDIMTNHPLLLEWIEKSIKASK